MVVRFDAFAVDSKSRQLRRGTDSVHLGPKAFELLELLLRNRPAVDEPPDPKPPTAPGGVRLRLFLEDREIALREGENLLGRLDEVVAWSESSTVSRRHARIVVSEGRATPEDLGSKNGTFLRGQRLTLPTPLSDGDDILLGRVRMTFRVLPRVSTQAEAGG